MTWWWLDTHCNAHRKMQHLLHTFQCFCHTCSSTTCTRWKEFRMRLGFGCETWIWTIQTMQSLTSKHKRYGEMRFTDGEVAQELNNTATAIRRLFYSDWGTSGNSWLAPIDPKVAWKTKYIVAPAGRMPTKEWTLLSEFKKSQNQSVFQ